MRATRTMLHCSAVDANDRRRHDDWRVRLGKLAYLLRSGLGQLAAERRACPNCGGSGAVVARKVAVTALRRCRSCALLFRTPTDPPSLTERFYDEEYSQGQ